MSILTLSTIVLLLLPSFVWATTVYTVDGSDSRIQYFGPWTKNPINDPQNLNVDGTLMFTSSNRSKAIFVFSGAIQVAVVGSFPVAGTYPDMLSEYLIDGAVVGQFKPPRIVPRPAYRQLFFQSDALSTSQHYLTIRNLGGDLYFDCILLTFPVLPTSSPSSITDASVTSSAPLPSTSPVSGGVISATQPTPSLMPTAQTTQSTEGLTSLRSSSISSIIMSSTTPPSTTSTDPAASTPMLSKGTQGQSSSIVSTKTSQRDGAAVVPRRVRVAVGVGCSATIVLVLAGACLLRRRRRHRSKAGDVNPFIADPGLTAVASEKLGPSAHVNRVSSTAPTSGRNASPYPPTDDTQPAESSTHASSDTDILHITAEELGGRTDMATYGPPASPPPASPLVPPSRMDKHYRDSLTPLTSSSVAPPSNSRRARRDTHELRVAVDAGVRLLGGPPGTRRDADLEDADTCSAVSDATLPPMYDAKFAT